MEPRELTVEAEPDGSDLPPSTDERPHLPLSLYVIALAYFIYGLVALKGAAEHPGRSIFELVGLCYLFIAPGLLMLRRNARIWALVFLWIQMILVGLCFLWTLVAPAKHLIVVWDGRVLDPDWRIRAYLMALVGVFFLFVFWQYRFLTSPEVKALFEPPVTGGDDDGRT